MEIIAAFRLLENPPVYAPRLLHRNNDGLLIWIRIGTPPIIFFSLEALHKKYPGSPLLGEISSNECPLFERFPL